MAPHPAPDTGPTGEPAGDAGQLPPERCRWQESGRVPRAVEAVLATTSFHQLSPDPPVRRRWGNPVYGGTPKTTRRRRVLPVF